MQRRITKSKRLNPCIPYGHGTGAFLSLIHTHTHIYSLNMEVGKRKGDHLSKTFTLPTI